MSALPWLQNTLPPDTGFDVSRVFGLVLIVCMAGLVCVIQAKPRTRAATPSFDPVVGRSR